MKPQLKTQIKESGADIGAFVVLGGYKYVNLGGVSQPKTDTTIPMGQIVQQDESNYEIEYVGDIKLSLKKSNYNGLEGGALLSGKGEHITKYVNGGASNLFVKAAVHMLPSGHKEEDIGSISIAKQSIFSTRKGYFKSMSVPFHRFVSGILKVRLQELYGTPVFNSKGLSGKRLEIYRLLKAIFGGIAESYVKSEETAYGDWEANTFYAFQKQNTKEKFSVSKLLEEMTFIPKESYVDLVFSSIGELFITKALKSTEGLNLNVIYVNRNNEDTFYGKKKTEDNKRPVAELVAELKASKIESVLTDYEIKDSPTGINVVYFPIKDPTGGTTIVALNSNVETAKSIPDFANEVINGSIMEENKKAHEKAIENYESQLAQYQTTMKKYEASLLAYNKKANAYKDKMIKYEQKIKEYESKIEAYNEAVAKYNADMKAYKKDLDIYNKNVVKNNAAMRKYNASKKKADDDNKKASKAQDAKGSNPKALSIELPTLEEANKPIMPSKVKPPSILVP
ncbi:MAG: hypothetical protein ACRC6B_12260, partial [Fusobacteriaceae bacterium]